jgi:hypothetical protein
MAKRGRRNTVSPTSKAPGAKEASGAAPSAEPSTPPQRTAMAQSDPPGALTQRLGTGRRVRTPPPQRTPPQPAETNIGAGRAQPGRLGRLQGGRQNSGSLEALANSPLAKKLKEKADQFQHIQEFLHNPAPFNLRKAELDTSSTAEEIESRKAEVRYQIQVMQSVVAVLTDELKELEQVRPSVSAAQTSSTKS